eukprot:210662-Chlamydomonas_euryale.AAC.3
MRPHMPQLATGQHNTSVPFCVRTGARGTEVTQPKSGSCLASLCAQGIRLQQALGLSSAGLPGAVARPLALTAAFFGGPLLLRLLDPRTHAAAVEALARAGRWVGRVAAAAVAGEWRAAAHVLSEPLADAHLLTWRNLVVAPLSEEFVFRGCMAPLLLMKVGQGSPMHHGS